MEGFILEKTVARNMANKLGCELQVLEPGTTVQLTDSSSMPDGFWYYSPGIGWIRARDIQIERDVEFMFKARDMGLMDLQMFGFSLGGVMSAIKSSPIISSTRKITSGGLGGLAVGGGFGGGIFGKSSTGALSSSSMGVLKQSASKALGSLGINISSKTIFGKALAGISYGDLMMGGIDELFGSLMDTVFSSLFDRLKFVVGYDLASDLLEYMDGSFGDLDTSDGPEDPYDPNNHSAYSPWTWLDYQASLYFKYLGCDGAMITRTFDGLSWEQDAYYTTPTLISKQNSAEVAFNQALYNADYSEFEDAVTATRKSLNLEIDRYDWFLNFNRYRITHPDYHLQNSRAYVFMTRPDLNIFDSSGSTLNESIKSTGNVALYYNAVLKHPIICQSLSSILASTHDFIPIISNTARSLDVQDMSLKTIEHAETLSGWKLVYAKNAIDSKTAGNISMNFIDDNMASITYMHLIWVEYIDNVVRGIVDPKIDYIRNAILDYASSLYYILTDQSGENIIFWTKYYGVFPTNVPSSAFSFNEGSPVHVPDIQIQYAYSFKEDMNPLALAEFNRNSSANENFEYVPIYNVNTFKCNGTIVGPPFIDTEDGGVTYKLRFRQKEN